MTPIRIVCVDDVAGAADDYARLVHAKTGLGSTGTSDPDVACDLLTQHPVDVVVLDQRMPQISGTDLFRKMKSIKPSVKAIMLTGEADASEAVDALQHLEYVRVIDKSKLDDLVPAVYAALARSEAERTITFPAIEVGRSGIHWLPLVPKSIYYLLSIELVKEASVPDHAWTFLSEVNAGQTKSFSRTVNREQCSTTISTSDYEIVTKGTASFSASKFAKIEKSLNGKISSRMQTQRDIKFGTAETISETIALPAEPVDPTEQAVKSRSFYFGPEMIKLRLRIKESHVASKVDQEHWLTVYHHTGYFYNKQIDVLTDGSRVTRITSRWP